MSDRSPGGPGYPTGSIAAHVVQMINKTFQARELARTTSGQFGKQHHTPADVALAPDSETGRDFLSRTMAGRSTAHLHPEGLTQTRLALMNRRGNPGGAARFVTLDWASGARSSGDEPLDVFGPSDGRPLIIDIRSGAANLAIVSGHAIVIAGTSDHARIEVCANAHADVIVERCSDVSVDGDNESSFDLWGEADPAPMS